uniref:Uncharacterized protein n=1 Tax=Octopus bimaculoides TaxID=37653 RepID=A0A0L8GM23_OCTBM
MFMIKMLLPIVNLKSQITSQISYSSQIISLLKFKLLAKKLHINCLLWKKREINKRSL